MQSHTVTPRSPAGREYEIVEARTGNSASIRASLTPADAAWLKGETERGFGPSARATLARELGL